MESGLVAYLQIPDQVTRLGILHDRCRSIGIIAESEALALLSGMEVGNIRELEGAFTRAVALATLNDGQITSDTVSKALNVARRPQPNQEAPRASQEAVMSSVAGYYGITLADLVGKKRSQKLSTARQAAMHIMAGNLHMGVTDISKILRRDHSTVSLALKRLDGTLPDDHVLQADIESINGMLYHETT